MAAKGRAHRARIGRALVSPVLLAALLLGASGCYSDGDYGRPSAPSAAPLPESPAAGYVVGDELPEDVAAELVGNVRVDERAYETLDGTVLLTRRYEPLPPAVRDDLLERAAFAAPAPGIDADAGALRDLEAAMTSTGKNVITVTRTCFGSDTAGEGPQAEDGEVPDDSNCIWYASRAMTEPTATSEAAVAASEAWVAEQATPGLYEVLVVPTTFWTVTPG
ncbi:hypothetical protein [Planctomonas psychrotolerans]|uniref:hypothetical protein n=1 Tax=Planctomonas psychrotolerans TaxID=2528712 RepID=UPI001D0D08F8|nr:hypothetical protein [Planctomonas psychrotolerans]